MGWSKLESMELDDEDQLDCACPLPVARRPRYPYSLRICLTHKELEKLGLDADCEIGSEIDLRAFAVVTSISLNETNGGTECRIELQIEKLAVQDEMAEATP